MVGKLLNSSSKELDETDEVGFTLGSIVLKNDGFSEKIPDVSDEGSVLRCTDGIIEGSKDGIVEGISIES